MSAIVNKFLITLEDGALTQLYLATKPDVEEKPIKGEYYVGPFKLWEFTKKLLKEKVPGYEGALI
jgi:hypothetical protein